MFPAMSTLTPISTRVPTRLDLQPQAGGGVKRSWPTTALVSSTV